MRLRIGVRLDGERGEEVVEGLVRAFGIIGCVEVDEQTADEQSATFARQLIDQDEEGDGACVKDGSWWWHRTAELLAEQDVVSEAPALPSCGETGEPTGAQGPGLVEDVAAVRGLLTAELQRQFARRADNVVELDAGHHPFLSQPAAVRDLVLSL
jgi:hypothetical protein